MLILQYKAENLPVITPTIRHTIIDENAYGSVSDDVFGASADMNDSYSIIGAPSEDAVGATNSGKAYIYNTATGTLLHTLDNPTPMSNDKFGGSVALSDSYAIIGAPGVDDAGGTDSGEAYIYNLSTGALLHTIPNPNAHGTSQDDSFGWDVDITDTYAIVSAYVESDTVASYSGKVYIFNPSTGALIHTVDNPNPYGSTNTDLFGRSVAINDTYFAVGAMHEDEVGGTSSGKVYIFSTLDGTLLHTLDNPNPYGTVTSDYFGYSIALSDSYLIAGANNEDDANGVDSGIAYIFKPGTGALLHTLDNPNPYSTSAGDNFGNSVAINDTYAAVSAPYEDDAGGLNSGKVYVFSISTGTLLDTQDNPNMFSTSAGDNFGYGIGITNTYLLASARYEYSGGGVVYIYDL